jgi:hypothetical protein
MRAGACLVACRTQHEDSEQKHLYDVSSHGFSCRRHRTPGLLMKGLTGQWFVRRPAYAHVMAAEPQKM